MEENRVRGGDRSRSRFSNVEERDSPAPEFESQTHSNFNQQHICVVTETYPPEINGVAITLSRLVNGLRARGNRVSVVHPRQRNVMLDSAFDDVHGSRVASSRVTTDCSSGCPQDGSLSKSGVITCPAAVYVATEGPLGWSAVRTAQSMGIPAVSGFHTNFHSYCKHYGVGWLQHVALRYLRWFHNQTERTLVSNEELRASAGRCWIQQCRHH